MSVRGADRVRGVREVEVKYRIDDLAGVVAALAARGVSLADAVLQDDQAYASAAWAYGQSKIGVPFARLRTQDGRHVFTVKTPVLSELDCTEHECEVSDRDQMHDAVLAMGFRPTVRIVKRRRTGRLGKLTLCLDEVDGLGTFLELEWLTDLDTVHAQAEMHALVASLGVTVHRLTETYDSLLRAEADVC